MHCRATINHVRLRARTFRLCKGFDLGWRKLSGIDVRSHEHCPQSPHLLRLPRSRSQPGQVASESSRSTPHAPPPKLPTGIWFLRADKTRQANLATHLCRLWVLLISCHSLFLILRGPTNGPPSTVRDGEERWDQPARKRGQTTRCSALYPTPSPDLAGTGDGEDYSREETHKGFSPGICWPTDPHLRDQALLSHCQTLARLQLICKIFSILW